MGCSCKFLKNESNETMTNEIIKKVEEISKDESKLDCVRKIQKNFRRKSLLLKLKTGEYFKTEDITDVEIEIPKEELETLFKEYPPLDDGVKIELNKPVKDYKTRSIYLGEWDFSKKMKHGRGIQYWEDGAKYYGYFIENKASKKGKLVHKDGSIYIGSWENDKPNGYGKYICTDGTIYEGEWKEDKQHGKGKEIWPDGAWYEGDYFNGEKHGKGKFYWADGSTYEGEFSHNNINGTGY
jgi:hypothetical protein